ncbi:MAG: NAD(P)H-hydrate epimerase [archaeon]
MLTVAQMRELEDLSEQNGVSRAQLMQNAGRAAADMIKERYPDASSSALVVSYHGNNGGDGFVVARHLGADVLFLGDENKLKPEARSAWDALDKRRIISDMEKVTWDRYALLVDSLLGTGTAGPLQGVLAAAVQRMNNHPAPIISLDVPTGVDPDAGDSSGDTIKADLIITFHDTKPGLVAFKNICTIVDIGIPAEAIAQWQLKQQ